VDGFGPKFQIIYRLVWAHSKPIRLRARREGPPRRGSMYFDLLMNDRITCLTCCDQTSQEGSITPQAQGVIDPSADFFSEIQMD